LAALRRYEEAREVLGKTVQEWFAGHSPALASYALSELLRVLGLLGDAEGLAAALRDVEHVEQDPALDDVSRAYLRLAARRAHVLAGSVAPGEPARDWLAEGPVGWDTTRPTLRRSRLRWLASAFDRAGRPDQAAAARATLLVEGEGFVEVLLARLDAAILAGA